MVRARPTPETQALRPNGIHLMSFQIHALDPEVFAPLFELDDRALQAHNACWMTVDTRPGFPCRIGLEDAPVGSRILLVNYEHRSAASPYRASHAIFVRPNAARAMPAPGTVPAVLASRLISWRAFDSRHRMVDADVIDGRCLADCLPGVLARPSVDTVDLHNARPGCFAARVTRA